jgi:hypothetical protein
MRDLLSYSLSPDHFAQAAMHNSTRFMKRMHTYLVVQVALAVFIAALVLIGFGAIPGASPAATVGLSASTLAVVAIACWVLIVVSQRQGMRVLLRKSTFAPGACQLGVDDDGLWLKGPHGESFTRWSGWRSVEERGDLVLLYHDDAHFYPVPFAAFQSAEERGEFVRHVRAKIAAEPGEVRSPSVPPPIPETLSPRPVLVATPPTFRALVATAAKLITFRRVSEGDLAVSWLQIVGLVIATLLPPLAFAALSIGDSGHFDFAYLPQVLFHVPVMLFAAVVLANVVGRTAHVSSILAGALLAWTAIDFLSLGAWLAVMNVVGEDRDASMAFYFVPIAWLALAVTRVALSLTPEPGKRATWVVAACTLFLALPLATVYRERSVWSMDYGKQANASRERRSNMMAAASEESFYRQHEILERALDGLHRGRPGVVDVFLVGMAGYGGQDVFMREVDSVAELFRERFGADGHIVKLVNNPKRVLIDPVASVTSLEAALKRVAEVMDRDEDVLVLFLTSHGSAEHEFTVQLWPLELKQITPAMLRRMLDASGIKNRVIVVSACYAGGFIDKLKDDNTLVVAAAAPDRNSFGCSNENDWTYFGKAYFDEGLRQTTSFTQAFEIARPLIEERERREKFDPSNPQMSLGGGIKVKLDELERQLAPKGEPAPG